MAWPDTQTQANWVQVTNPLPGEYANGSGETSTGRFFLWYSVSGDDVLFYTDDDGANWSQPTINKPAGHTFDFQGRILQTASGRLLLGSARPDDTYWPVLFSDDNGDTWDQMSAGSSISSTIGRLEQKLQTSTGRIFAGETNHLYASDDDGASWFQALRFSSLAEGDSAIIGNGRILIAGRSDMAYSDDDGDTWTEGFIPVNDYPILAYFPDTGRVLISDYTQSDQLAKSDDNGETWTDITPFPGENGFMVFDNDLLLWINLAQDRIYHSTDQGDTWDDAGNGPTGGALFASRWEQVLASGKYLKIQNSDDGFYYAETDYSQTAPEPEPPPPWWTGYEGVTEVRRA